MSDVKEPRRRFVLPGWRALAIGGGAAGFGIVALVALHDPAPRESRFVVAAESDNMSTPVRTDPLMVELLRCRAIPAGSDDPACREAWEVNRRRFMGESRSYIAPTPGAASSRQAAER